MRTKLQAKASVFIISFIFILTGFLSLIPSVSAYTPTAVFTYTINSTTVSVTSQSDITFPGRTGWPIALYSWDWGDGSPLANSTSNIATHTYANTVLDRTIKLTVTDTHGGTATVSKSITLTNNSFFGTYTHEMEKQFVSANISYGGNIADGSSHDASAIQKKDGGYWIHNAGGAQGYVETYNFKNPTYYGPSVRENILQNMTFEPYSNFANITIDYVSIALLAKSDHGIPAGHFSFTTNSPDTGNTQAYPMGYGNWTDGPNLTAMTATGGYPSYLPLLRLWTVTDLRNWTIGDLMSNSSFRVIYVWNPIEDDFYFDYIGIWYDYHYSNDTKNVNQGFEGPTDTGALNQLNGLAWMFVIFLPASMMAGVVIRFDRFGACAIFVVGLIGTMILVAFFIDTSFFVFTLMGIIGGVIVFYKGLPLSYVGLYGFSVAILVLTWIALIPMLFVMVPILIYAGTLFIAGSSEVE
jgi:hypothetical protein